MKLFKNQWFITLLVAVCLGGVALYQTQRLSSALEKEAFLTVNLEAGAMEKTELNEKYEALLKEKEELAARLDALLKENESGFSLFPHDSRMLNQTLKSKGLENGTADVVASLKERRDLIPYEGILGGTMDFYSEEGIWVLSHKWVLAYFDDGHIIGYMLLSYDVQNGEVTDWKVMDAFLDGEQ